LWRLQARAQERERERERDSSGSSGGGGGGGDKRREAELGSENPRGGKGGGREGPRETWNSSSPSIPRRAAAALRNSAADRFVLSPNFASRARRLGNREQKRRSLAPPPGPPPPPPPPSPSGRIGSVVVLYAIDRVAYFDLKALNLPSERQREGGGGIKAARFMS